ncbi:MAG: hypothetical protein IPL53_16075 [Ignavibacteria bacterium]|nr:hypothetical protein [Ignavibacteria bacterium]
MIDVYFLGLSKAYAIGSGTGYRISTDGGVTFNVNTSLSPSTRNHIALLQNISKHYVLCCSQW